MKTFNKEQGSKDEQWMRHCLDLARTNVGTGNLRIASIVLRGSQIVAESVEDLPAGLDPVAHAEALAVQAACLAVKTTDLSDCVLYTTAEPCWLCSYLIRVTGIMRVVYGCASPTIGGDTSNYPILRTTDVLSWVAPPEIVGGVLEQECKALRGSGC